MSTLAHRYSRPLAEIVDWLELPWAAVRPVASHPVRVEHYEQDGSYVVRAELPGIDPGKDLEVTVSRGVLTIKAERHGQTEGKRHSEFHYGSFTRGVTLPEGADEDHIQACYDAGIVEVCVRLKGRSQQKMERQIPVMINQHIKPT